MYPVSNVTSPPDVGAAPPGLDAYAAGVFGRAPAGAPPKEDPYADDAKLLKTFKDASKECSDRRTSFERVWWRLLLYLLGRQWIYYERSLGQWLDKRLQKWVPRPVTNKIAETLNAILSVFQSVTLAVACRAEGGDPNDILVADTANRYEAPLRDDHDMTSVQDQSDWWLTALGNVWWFLWWDYSGDSRTQFVPWEQCASCQDVFSPLAVKNAGDVCPACKHPILNPAMSAGGTQIGAKIAPGHGRTDVCSPLEISFPPIYANPDDTPMLIRRRWRTKKYLEERLTKEQISKINFQSMATERSLQLLRALASMTELGGSPNMGSGGEPSEGEGVTEAELWMKPCKDYPEGLILRVVDATDDGDGILVRQPEEGTPGPLPFKAEDGRVVWPWIHTGYEKFGGRGWARSPLEHLIEKQNQLNQLDSLIQMIVQRTANPVWLEPKGAEVQRFTGEPGLVVKYNPLVAGGNAKPERIEGSNIPSSLVKLREMLIADIENLAGTFDIIKGQKPAGVEAFSAMQLLVERSQSRFGKVLEARGVTYRRWFRIALDLERRFGSDERAYAILGPNGGYVRVELQKRGLDGSIRIDVEDGSQMPKTSLGTRAAVQQLQALNVIDTTNPETRYSILQIFGQTRLQPGLDAQVMGARRVEQAFEAWANAVQFTQMPAMPMTGPAGALVTDPLTGQPQMAPATSQPSLPPPGQVKAWQDSVIYLTEFKKWASGDVMQEMLTRKPQIEPYLSALIYAHQAVIDQQMAMQAAMAAPQGKDPNGRDGKGVGAGRAFANSQQESGKPGVNTGPAHAA